ncbi:helix-turn-helix domain-containing protein [Micromonospora peucetia]|uniref:helix-turn-helix domain-containing protein n=1 Tax=Micromonospora peucetia TaxID=47871 RepID=UPI00331BB6E8
MDGETFGQVLRRLRQERRLSLRKMQVLTSYDFTYLGQVERGEKPGSVELAEVCDRALGVDGLLVKAYGRVSAALTRYGNQEDEMRRRTAIQALAASPLAFVDQAEVVPELQVSRLERNAEIYRHLYHGSGKPRDLLSLARDHLDTAVDVVRQLPDGGLKRRVLSTRSEVATLAGRLTFFDLQRPADARGYFGLAHEAAIQVGDGLLAAAALGHLAFVPAAEHNTSAAISYLAGAADHARRSGVPVVQSWIAAVESEVLGTANAAGTLRALDQAAARLSRPADAAPPVWFDYYSADRLDGFRGRAFLQLGRPEEARSALAVALRGLGPMAVKQKAVFLIDIASSYLGDHPQLDQACDLAGDAAATLAMAGYATASTRLQEFRTRLRPWDDATVVADLDERLGALTT